MLFFNYIIIHMNLNPNLNLNMNEFDLDSDVYTLFFSFVKFPNPRFFQSTEKKRKKRLTKQHKTKQKKKRTTTEHKT